MKLITLLKDGCLFRSCSQSQVWSCNDFQLDKFDMHGLRRLKPHDLPKIVELHNSALFPQFRHSLSRNKQDFKKFFDLDFSNRFKKYQSHTLVLENFENKAIEGYIDISTADGNSYWLNIVLSLPYVEYYSDFVKYASSYVNRFGDDKKLQVMVRKYFQGANVLLEYLESAGYNLDCSQEVLVKDYWRPKAVNSDEKASPIVLFPDITSTACNRYQRH